MRKVLLLLLFPVLVVASRSHLDVFAEWLYWKPATQGAFFGKSSGEFFYVQPEWASGVRVGFRHNFCDGHHDFEASYLSIDSSRLNRSRERLEFSPLGSDLDGAEARVKLDYKVADFVVGASFVRRSVLVLRLYAGLEGVYLRGRDTFRFGSGENFDREQCFRAIGPLFGIGATYCMWGNFKWVANLGVSALFGSRELSDTVDEYPSSNIITPGFRAQLGARYTHCFRCLTMWAEIGVAARHYPNAFVNTLRRNSGLNILLEDITYGGPYFALTAHF